MNRKILLFGFVFALFISFVSAQDLYADIDLNAEKDLYANINLDGEQKSVAIDGVDYKGYVDERTKGGLSKGDIAKMFKRSVEFFKGERNELHSSNYEISLANTMAEVLSYFKDNIYENWILPLYIKQNAIIKTLDQEVYCKNLAEEYFKVYPNSENFKCSENGKTYYQDLDYAIQIN
ncbi:MAG: hypothetical protein ACOC5T_07015 [Elusimicrobiota bacterium]